MNPKLAAIYYAEHFHWPVFPVRGKVPATAHGFKDATCDPVAVAALWGEHAEYGVAVATGHGLGVLDIDPRSGGEDGFEKLLDGRTLAATPTALTGGGGRHYYFAVPLDAPSPSRTGVFPGVDWKCDGGYVVAPPSTHPNGKPYLWEESARPNEVPLAPAPDWLLRLVQWGTKRPGGPPTPAVLPQRIPEGERHGWLKSFAGKLRWLGLGEGELLAAFRGLNESGRFDPPIDACEIERMASDYAKKDAGPPLLEAPGKNGQAAVHPPPSRVADLVGGVMDLMIHPEKRRKGFLTGFYALDDMTGGLHRGEVTILGARTSIGKSSLALRIAEQVATEQSVLFFTVEMLKAQVVNNLIVGVARVDSGHARRGKLDIDEIGRIVGKAEALGRLNLWVDDTPGLDVAELSARARAFVTERPDTLVVVDYLQIVAPSSGRIASRQEQVTEISRAIMQLARELDVPILAMSQLNREADSRSGHVPMLADLRESGSIEQDASCVLLLNRPGYYSDSSVPKSKTILDVAKNRNGPTGAIELTFLEKHMRFENAARFPQQGDGEHGGADEDRRYP